MRTHIHRGMRIALGVLAATSLLAIAPSAARADWSNNNNSGWSRQGHDWDHGGWRQDANHGNRWAERRTDGVIVYHDHPSYFYHPYRGPEHRRYYTYNGAEFYVNTDTGIRVRVSL
jgi:hypothetical protein